MKRKMCEECNKTLSIYNKTGKCYHHSYPPGYNPHKTDTDLMLTPHVRKNSTMRDIMNEPGLAASSERMLES